MIRRKLFLKVTLFAAVFSLGIVTAFPQGVSQQMSQQQQQQQQMLQMQNMVQAMTTVMERAQNMVANLEQRLQNLPENAKMAIEQHRNLHHMGEAMERVADNMKQNIERFQEMAQNRELTQNQAMNKEIKGLQVAMGKVTEDMEDVIALLESIAKRLGDGN
jgi:prophage DNA circulation protein